MTTAHTSPPPARATCPHCTGFADDHVAGCSAEALHNDAYWQADSAAAWDRCEEHRVRVAELEALLIDAETACKQNAELVLEQKEINEQLRNRIADLEALAKSLTT